MGVKLAPSPSFVTATLDATDLYLDLVKRAILGSLNDENGWYVIGSLDKKDGSFRSRLKQFVVNRAWKRGLVLAKPNAEGIGTWGLLAYTMVGERRLDNIRYCIEEVVRNKVPGDLIETGAWRGGVTIYMRAVLKALGVTDRKVWVADSFEGLPSYKGRMGADAQDAETDIDTMNDGGPVAKGLAVSLEQVRSGFDKFGLLDDQVEFLKGWFENTLPKAPITKLSILRLDGDMYASTMDALNALYHKVSCGGYVIVDDYNSWPHCKRAIDEFRAANKIASPMTEIDEHSVFWQA